MTKRTAFLMVLAPVCGAGGGLLTAFVDGLYGPALFVAFPFVSGLLFASIAYDVATEAVVEYNPTISSTPEKPESAEIAKSHTPAAA